MKTNKKIGRKILYPALGCLALWAAYSTAHARPYQLGTVLDPLFSMMSDYQINVGVLIVAGLIMMGLLAGLFSILSGRMLKKHRLAEERYKSLVELSNDIITVADGDGNLIFINDAGCRVLERTPEEVIGRPFTELLHPADRGKSLAKHKVLEKTNIDTYSIEIRYLAKSGKVVNVQQNARVLKDEKGAFLGTQSMARDITERKRENDALQQAVARAEAEKTRTESILSAIGDGISIQSTDFKVLYQNQAQRNMTGDGRVGQFCYQAYSDTDGLCPDCPMAEAFQDGEIHTFERTLSRDGAVRYFEIKASPLRNATGAIIAGIESTRDITSRKNREEKLKMFSAAIEEAIDGIQILDREGHVVYSNKAISEMRGYSHEELVGRHFNEMNADQKVSPPLIISQTITKGRWSGELSVTHRDGGTFPVLLSLSLVKDERGQPVAMIGIMRDITESKNAERIMKRHHEQLMMLVEERTEELSIANEQLHREIADREKMEELDLLKTQKLESLGILAGGIAHDFNNLLSSIMGNISLAMLDLNPDDSAYWRLAGAEKVSLRAQNLTNQLLTFAKGGTPVKKTTAINDLIREVTGFTPHSTRVKFFYSLPDDLWHADVDENQISQVIQNLILNADHAMPEGGTITISSENEVVAEPTQLPLKPGDYVRISVRDHGVGISREHLSKIFDPYFTTKENGSGLGLATSHSIIRQHGGHIFAESETGKGTTLVIYLRASPSKAVAKRTGEMKLLTGTGRILLLDDEEDVRLTTGDMLMRLGYSVEFIDDGARAVDLYQGAREAGKPFDVVILNLTIPGGMGGEETLKKLLEIDPAVKAIVLSGYSNDPIMVDYRRHGFSGVVSKPFGITELGETLHVVLQETTIGLPGTVA